MRIDLRGMMCGGRRARLKPRAAAAWLAPVAVVLFALVAWPARAQEAVPRDEAEFGPVVRAYLGYLRAEQEVTDDRASRREVSAAYVRRNSNRIRALRQMAVRIARESRNDYLPELYAVARDELGTLFESPPRPETFGVGEVFNDTFRFLGPVRAGEVFYVFARLDVYEQAELLKKQGAREGAPAARPAGAEAQTGKTAAGGVRQPNEAKKGGAQNGAHNGMENGAQPVGARQQQSAPATRPRRVPPPESETGTPPSAPRPAKQR